jgi:hypothetical protein
MIRVLGLFRRLWRNHIKMDVMTVWTGNSIVTIFTFVDVANVLQERPVRFQWVELLAVTCYALHPASVRIGKFEFIGKATERAFEESG